MKKTTKPLHIQHETIHRLTSHSLVGVRGGGTIPAWPTAPGTGPAGTVLLPTDPRFVE